MNTAKINLTDTMLKKSIIDANKSVCEFAKTFSFDYNEAECGDRKPFEAMHRRVRDTLRQMLDQAPR